MKSNRRKEMAHKNKTSKRVKKWVEVVEVVAQGQEPTAWVPFNGGRMGKEAAAAVTLRGEGKLGLLRWLFTVGRKTVGGALGGCRRVVWGGYGVIVSRGRGREKKKEERCAAHKIREGFGLTSKTLTHLIILFIYFLA